MPRPRRRKWTFQEGIAGTAAELKVPYSRLYNLLPVLGLTVISNEHELKCIALALLKGGGISIEGLIKVFGGQMTLSQLDDFEHRQDGDGR